MVKNTITSLSENKSAADSIQNAEKQKVTDAQEELPAVAVPMVGAPGTEGQIA